MADTEYLEKLRDEIAVKTLELVLVEYTKGSIAGQSKYDLATPAKFSYMVADAMLAARAKVEPAK